MLENGRISWMRVGVEGTVIVVSILLAFAIDAWWDEQKSHAAELEQLTRVLQEMQANSARVQRKLDTIRSSIRGTEEFIGWMGPEPADVAPDTYHAQWGKFFSIGNFSILKDATDDHLSTGIAARTRHREIRDKLWEWRSVADDLEKQYGLLRIAHARVNDYADDLVPALHDAVGTGIVNQELASKFPYDNRIVLSNPFMESRVATYLVRLEFVVGDAENILEKQSRLIALIEAATAP